MTVAPPEYSRNYLLAAFLYLRELGRAGPRQISDQIRGLILNQQHPEKFTYVEYSV